MAVYCKNYITHISGKFQSSKAEISTALLPIEPVSGLLMENLLWSALQKHIMCVTTVVIEVRKFL